MVNSLPPQLAPTDTLPQDRLRSLYQAIQRMNSTYELSELLSFLLEQVVRDTGGQRGYLLLAREPAPGDAEPCLEVKALAGSGLDPAQVEADVLYFISRTVVQDVLERGEPRAIRDLRQDDRYKDRASSRSAQLKWQSILAVPLKVPHRLIGLMYVEHPGRNAFANPDLEFLSAFAVQAATAIDRAQQNQRRIQELERLNEVSRSVVRVLDLDQVLIRILREATHMLQVETGSVLLVEGSQTSEVSQAELVFRVAVQDGRPVHIAQRLRVGQGVAGWVAQHRQPLLMRDVQSDPRWYGEVETGFSTRSILCVPLEIDGHVIGVLQALNKKGPTGFTERDMALLSAFATSATVAIENARLFGEARQARELRALNELAAALSSSLELETVLAAGLERALAVMRLEAGVVALVDGQRGELAVAATRGWRGEAPRQGARVPAGDRLLGWVASTSRAWTGNEGGGLASAVQALCAPGSQCVMFGPLRAGGQVVGALGVMSYAPHTFTPEEFEVFSAIGGMFGVAVENARLYEEARANLTQIAYFNDVGSALTASLDLERVLQIIMERITTLIGVERASIFLIDDNTNDLVLEYSFGGHESIRLPAPWPGIVGWIAARGTSAIVNDVHNDPRFLADIDAATRFDTRSILGAPLKLDERVIGVVEMLNKLEGPFAERDRKLLVDFSKWAAIALHNARLYRELNEARERLANAEAVAVMGDMALNLTHELSNRISLVTPTLSRMRAKCQAELSNPYLDRKLKVIGRVADESKTIIRRIREPFEVADEQPVNPAECLAEAIGSFQMRPGIKVIERYQRDLPPVMATREKLTQAFCHIIGNALDAMGERGELLLSTRRRLDGLLEVVISDDGPGMPEATQKRVFDLGFTTKGDQGGLGLGLWWTRMYVNRLRGQVKLQSTPGRGTVVSIRLPTLGEKSP